MGLGAGGLDDHDGRGGAGRVEAEGVGADPVDRLVAGREGNSDGERPGAVAGDVEDGCVAGAADLAVEKVHRRGADEGGDEGVGRAVVELERRADLLDIAVAHDDDAVGHRHRLDLVVRDVDRRGAEALVQRADLGAHRHAELGVEVRERLVEEEDRRVAHDGAAHRDALALAAGELARQPLQIALEVKDAGGAPDEFIDLALRPPCAASARKPCCRRPACAGRARSSGTP